MVYSLLLLLMMMLMISIIVPLMQVKVQKLIMNNVMTQPVC